MLDYMVLSHLTSFNKVKIPVFFGSLDKYRIYVCNFKVLGST